jgi:hypothetical protein
MKSLSHAAVVFVAVLVFASAASACPVCESETGQQVKAGIFNDQFWGNVLLIGIGATMISAGRKDAIARTP